MSILIKIDQDFKGWSKTKKPELHGGGFFDDIDTMIEYQNELFNRAMGIIRKGFTRLYPTVPERLRVDFIKLYHRMTNGEIPSRINVQPDDVKHSVSIRIDLWLPRPCHHAFFVLMEKQNKVLPFDCVFTPPDAPRAFSEKWTSVNTQFAFYLIRMLAVRII